MSYCTSQGAQIASIHSDTENAAATKLIPNGVGAYIGAESDGTGNWKWRDGTTWWQPKDHGGLEGRGETRIAINCPHCKNDRKWHDWANGEAQHGVLCRVPGGLGDICMRCLIILCWPLSTSLESPSA